MSYADQVFCGTINQILEEGSCYTVNGNIVTVNGEEAWNAGYDDLRIYAELMKGEDVYVMNVGDRDRKSVV